MKTIGEQISSSGNVWYCTQYKYIFILEKYVFSLKWKKSIFVHFSSEINFYNFIVFHFLKTF